MTRQRRQKWVLALLTALLLLGLTAGFSTTVLTVRLPRQQGELVAGQVVAVGDLVVIAYRHSVERTRVEGRFRVARGSQLTIEQTRMTSVGTGMPNTYPQRTTREGQWMVVDEEARRIDELRFFFSSINQTRITARDRELPLDGLPTGSLVVLDVESTTRPRLWLWHFFGVPWTLKDQAAD